MMQTPGTWQGLRTPLVLLTLAVVTASLYGQATRFEFLTWEDPEYVWQRPEVLSGLNPSSLRWALTSLLFENWFPLTWMSHMLDVSLFGTDAGGHHLTSIILHSLNSLLMFFVLRSVTGAFWRPFLVALLFAVHPQHVESVAWVSERKDVLSSFFGLCSLWAWGRFTMSGSRAAYGVSFVLFLLSLMSKPMLVTLPLLLLVLDIWPLERFSRRRAIALLVEKIPFLAASLAAGLVTIVAQEPAIRDLSSHPVGLRITNAADSILLYAWKTAVPVDLAYFYPYPARIRWPLTLAALTFITGVSVLAFRERLRRPYLLSGWLWYLIALLPVLGLLQVGYQARADRYTYLPLTGLFWILAWSLAEVVHRLLRPALLAATAAWTLLITIVCHGQIGTWRNDAALYGHAVRVTDDNAKAMAQYAAVLQSENRPEEARRYALESVRLDPQSHNAHQVLALLARAEGRSEEALAQARRLLAMNPGYSPALRLAAEILLEQNRPEAAIPYLEQIPSLRSDPLLLSSYAGALFEQRRLPEALRAYQRVATLAPNSAEARYNSALTLELLGRTEEAIANYRASLALYPDFLAARLHLGVLLAQQGQTGEARTEFIAVLAKDPDSATALGWLQKLPEP